MPVLRPGMRPQIAEARGATDRPANLRQPMPERQTAQRDVRRPTARHPTATAHPSHPQTRNGPRRRTPRTKVPSPHRPPSLPTSPVAPSSLGSTPAPSPRRGPQPPDPIPHSRPADVIAACGQQGPAHTRVPTKGSPRRSRPRALVPTDAKRHCRGGIATSTQRRSTQGPQAPTRQPRRPFDTLGYAA